MVVRGGAIRHLLLSLACVSLLSGCQTSGVKQGAGTLVGGIVGGLAGSQVGSGKGRVVAVIAGSLFGAWAGSEIGGQMDQHDRAAVEQSSTEAIATGEDQSWSNPDSGASGTVAVVEPAAVTDDNCRTVEQTVTLSNGSSESRHVTACQLADGSWKLV